MESFTGNTSLPYRVDDLDCSRLSQSGLQPVTRSDGMFGASISNMSSCQPNTTQLFNVSQREQKSPAQIDPFFTQGESLCADDALDETWVTVFGFPPSTTSFILQEFSHYGNILKHSVAPNGNWLRIQYQSKLQAKKALSKNGKVFGGSVMVGVMPCIDKDVVGVSSPAPGPSSLYSSLRSGMSSTMMSLTATLKNNDYQVAGKTGVPQRRSNFVSKAMEYVFGW